jgi:hypothetical protein
MLHSMKRLFALWLLLALNVSLPAAVGPREAQWKNVEDAMNKGLPRTAITNLEPIIAAALKEKAYGEAAKAIARKIVLEGNIQGNKPEEKITRLEAEITKGPAEMKPLLQTILANWYWHYFQNNRWRFLQRTATAAEPGKDFTTWDLPRLFAEIDKHFQTALAAADTLKKTPISVFDDLLQKGTVPDAYRPTLYDFIAHEALKFYTSGEQVAARAEDEFELPVGDVSPGVVSAFAPLDQFVALDPLNRPISADQVAQLEAMRRSPKGKAYFLFLDLLRFHLNDADKSAVLDADLARLHWAYNIAFGEDKTVRYKSTLKALTEKWADHELSALALHHWASVLQSEGELVEARTLAKRGEQVFPQSFGGKMCRNLVNEIEARSASITTERVWNAPLPKIAVSYKNVTNIYFRAVAWDWNVFLQRRHSRPESLNDNERKELMARAPSLEWSARLPATPDFKERVEELPAPAALKPGFYFLIASHDRNFSDTDNQVTFTDFWVSDLALVVRTHDGSIDGFVLAAGSGEPIAGAEVLAWHLDNNGNRVPSPASITDENGFFALDVKQQNRGYLLRARAKVGDAMQELGSMNDLYVYPQGKPTPQSQTIFFTDRALYRPGQTIQYKGICLRVDQEKDDYKLLPGQKLTVIFSDPNGKEIAKAAHQCNDYGSFSGSFTAPRDRLMGNMQLRVTPGPNGSAGFNVEEYKRPKFQVTLDAPKVAAKLADTVSLQGKAESYTGAAVDGAPVKWRVVREVRWPVWWGWSHWWRGPQQQGSQEIAHGTARTGTDGTFKIEFTAKPDPKVSEKDEATFNFSIHADVTDTAGETRSAERGVHVGFTALTANLTADDWQTEEKAVELKIKTTTLDGEAQPAEGSVKIYKLKEPAQVQRATLGGYQPYHRGGAEPPKSAQDLSNPNNWELGEMVSEKGFTTDAEGNAAMPVKLGVGVYRGMLETQDRFGKKVTARLPLRVLKPGDTKLAIKIPHLLASSDWSLEPGQEFMAVWGTGYDAGRAFIEIEQRRKMIQRYWTKPGETQAQIKQAVTEAQRGGFTLHVTQVRENRAYLDSRKIDVPWSNKNLEIKWEHFVSKLQPAQKETWTAVVTGPDAQKAVAEMVATLYDESLDAFMRHQWMQRFNFFRQDYSSLNSTFENLLKPFQHLRGNWNQEYVHVDWRYREFPADLTANVWGYGFIEGRSQNRAFGGMPNRSMMAMDGAVPPAAVAPMMSPPAGSPADREQALLRGDARKREAAGEETSGGAKAPDLSQVSARKNLNETAFFFPQLIADASGTVKMQFTMPEALTQWRFLGFAHDKEMRSGFLSDKAVTAKDLMVQPNSPRFLREGDVLEFTVKVSNRTAARQSGKVRLTLNEAYNDSSADKALGNTKPELDFDIPAKESRSYSWKLKVPDGLGFLTYKAVGSTGRVSDGEEGFLPVLSRRIFVTESLPLPIRGKPGGGAVTKKFEFTKLNKSGKSDTLTHQSLTVQMVSNPSWYAVMALPYLMEFPHECSEQVFNRLYANALARSIANSDPKIHRVFEQWRGTPALDSPLEKNQDLKSVMLEETPWLRQAKSESQARRNVGVLFDDNRLNTETAGTLRKLTKMQLGDGSWPWFPGGKGNDYITLYITTGFGRLRHLGVDVSVAPALKSLARLDNWMDEHYREILKWKNKEDYVPSSTDALYLYGRSFFLKDKPLAKQHNEMADFFLGQARRHWLKVANRQSQGHLAIALQRWGGAANVASARGIMKSIKERSVTSEEMGMFWRETELSWWWYRAPIETQALMVEAFDEIMGDAAAVEECKVWLLKQKQTQDWKTTKATADAIYALLLRGKNVLASDALVEVSLGGQVIKPGVNPRADNPMPAVEAGTGFYEKKFSGAEIKARLGEITVKKTDEGVAWGSVHWQYFEDMSKVASYEGTPLKLKKSLYTRVASKTGPVLELVKGALSVGAELVVRIELRVDRDMEYIHLKDQRGSGTEPVNVISRYRYQDGLGYYESTRDTASHFFIDYLPKGAYVFEYSTRVQHRGQYQTGMAEIQCMYAPEFNSHSESLMLKVN